MGTQQSTIQPQMAYPSPIPSEERTVDGYEMMTCMDKYGKWWRDVIKVQIPEGEGKSHKSGGVRGYPIMKKIETHRFDTSSMKKYIQCTYQGRIYFPYTKYMLPKVRHVSTSVSFYTKPQDVVDTSKHLKVGPTESPFQDARFQDHVSDLLEGQECECHICVRRRHPNDDDSLD